MTAQRGRVKFRHSFIDPKTIGTCNTICLVGDVNNDGFLDVVIGSYSETPVDEGYLVWYEYPNWKRHLVARANLEAGGVLVDVNRDGRLDVVAGQPYYGRELYWFENPPNPTDNWIRHTIDNSFQKYHDQAVGDLDNDGEDEIVVASQVSRVLVYYDIPPDPTVSPWPREYRHLICDDICVEGLAVADLDGDGVNEVVAGTNIFKPQPDLKGKWSRRILSGILSSETKVQVADINEDGVPDIVMSEAESDVGRLVWFEGPDYKIHILNENLFHPHSLAVTDFDGDGHLDIFVGEMHLGVKRDAKLIIYLNDGEGCFKEYVVVDEGTGTHEAKVADIGKTGKPSIVGKPFKPKTQVDLWENMSGSYEDSYKRNV